MAGRYDRVNGVFNKVNKRFDKVNGVWQPVKKRFVKAGGVWQPSFTSGIPLGSVPVGTKIKFGFFEGSPIVQKVVNISGSDVTLITDEIINYLAFDAKEGSNSDSNCRKNGNIRYAVSNIHQWLNSEAGAGSWYVAQHEADQVPDVYHVQDHNYDWRPGFLSQFSAKEKNCLKTKTITADTGGFGSGWLENTNARIWLPNATEVGMGGSTRFKVGSQLAAFSDNNSRIAYWVTGLFGTAREAGYYWLCTLDYSTYRDVFYIKGSGEITSVPPFCSAGVRPLCVLDSSVMLSQNVDADGCYTLI